MRCVYVLFRNRQHADNVRLALDQQPIGDDPDFKILCERAGKDKRRSEYDPRPEIEAPLIYHIRETVQKAYSIKYGGGNSDSIKNDVAETITGNARTKHRRQERKKLDRARQTLLGTESVPSTA